MREMRFEYGRTDQVSPRIRRVVANNPGPFTYLGTGTYVVGRGEVAVIDPGPDDPAHLEALLAAVAGERVVAVLTTHTHADHSPLAHPFAAATGAKVYGLPAPGVDTGFDESDQASFRPHAALAHGQRLEGPGWTLEVIATPGHASNHLAYSLVEEDALFSGDHVMGWSTTVVSPMDGDMAAYLASLEDVAARGFATLWPTHGPPVTEVAPFVAAYRQHRLEREAQVLAQLAAGRGRVADMVPALYADVPPRLHPAAAHSLWAHLIKLVRDGAAVCEDPQPGLASRYRLAGSRG